MTLRLRTLLITGLTLVGLIGGLYVVSSTILQRSIAAAEQEDTRRAVKAAQGSVEETIRQLDSRFLDWSAWDDAYRFVLDHNRAFIKANLVPGAFTSLRVNLIAFIDPANRVVFATGYDLARGRVTPVPAGVRRRLVPGDLLLARPAAGKHVAGILLLDEGPMIVTAQPILTSDQKGPVHGTFLVGRYLDATQVNKLAEITRSQLAILPYGAAALPGDFLAARSALRCGCLGVRQAAKLDRHRRLQRPG